MGLNEQARLIPGRLTYWDNSGLRPVGALTLLHAPFVMKPLSRDQLRHKTAPLVYGSFPQCALFSVYCHVLGTAETSHTATTCGRLRSFRVPTVRGNFRWHYRCT